MGGSRRPRGAIVAARPHVWAAVLLALVVFAYLWPVLVGGKILSPIADLYPYVPWQHSAPSDLHSYYNPTLFDLPVVDYPWRVLVRRLIHEGTFPAWDPYALGGIPLYSNPQTGLFSPFNLPLWILPLTYGLGVSAAAKLLAGAFGTYLLVRQMRLGFLPGLFAGIAFAFSAVNITWLAHETLPGVVVMLPWALWLVERIFERGRLGSAIWLAIVIAIGLGGGHPGMQVHLLVVTAVYALARAACSRGPASEPDARASGGRLRALMLVGGGLAAGALLMAFMLVPEARSSHDTVGVLARKTASLPGAKLPFSSIKTVLFPDWWGRPSALEPVPDASNIAILFANFCERTFYAGTVALLFACVGVLAQGAWRRKVPFVLIGILGLAIALRAPGLSWLVTHLPILESVEPQRLHLAFAFAVSVLAAFGLQALLDAPTGNGRRLAVPLAATLVGVLALTSTGAQGSDVRHTLTHFLTGQDFPLDAEHATQGILALTSVVWFLLFALAVGVLLLLAHARPRWRHTIAIAIVLLAAADAYHFAHGFQPMGPAAKVIPPVTPAIAYLERHRTDGRIVGFDSALPNDWGLVYGLEDVRGYDPPQPTQRMFDLWRVVNPEQGAWTPFALRELGLPQVHVLAVLGARYIVAEPGIALGRGGGGVLRTVYAGRDATIVANRDAVPRAMVPAHARMTADEAATRELIAEAGFDPRTTVAVERGQPGVAALAPAPGAPAARSAAPLPPAHGSGSVTVVHTWNARVTLRARLDRGGLVVLNDQLTDGWAVRVDGRPAPALRVNGVMRGVLVPAGQHQIEWSYTVPGLRLGVLLSLLALTGLGGSGIALAVRARRRDRMTAGAWRR